MSRSSWKLPLFDTSLLNTNKYKKVYSRNFLVPSSLIGKIVFVHNGKSFLPVKVSRDKVGFKFGEFSFTRKLGAKKKKKKR